jgi:hypothetical protein
MQKIVKSEDGLYEVVCPNQECGFVGWAYNALDMRTYLSKHPNCPKCGTPF